MHRESTAPTTEYGQGFREAFAGSVKWRGADSFWNRCWYVYVNLRFYIRTVITVGSHLVFQLTTSLWCRCKSLGPLIRCMCDVMIGFLHLNEGLQKSFALRWRF